MKPLTNDQQAIVDTLKAHGPMTYSEVVQKLARGYSTVERQRLLLHKIRPRVVYVADVLTPPRGRGAKVWAAGNRPDAVEQRSPTRKTLSAAVARFQAGLAPPSFRLPHYGPHTVHLQSIWQEL